MQKPPKPANWLLWGGLVAILALTSVLVHFFRLEQTSPTTTTIPPVATAPAAPAPTPKPASDNATLVLELFNPSDTYLTHQLNETAISQQIEQVLSVSFVLTRCQLITEADYADSFRALIVFAQRMRLAHDAATAEARVRQIAESAGTSYALVYSRTPCNSLQLPTLRSELLTWQNAILGK